MNDSSASLSGMASPFLRPGKEHAGSSGGIRGLASHLRKRKRRGDRGSGLMLSSSLAGGHDVSSSSLLCPLPEGASLKDEDLDNVSISSLDMLQQEAPETKRSKRTMSRVGSLASVLSTPMHKMGKMGNALQRSLSGVKLSAPMPQLPPPPSPGLGPPSGSAGIMASPSPSVASLTTTASGRMCSTPTRSSSFLSRSFSTAGLASSMSSTSLLRAPESPCANLKRGGSGRGSTVHLTPYKPPPPTPNKARPTRYWSTQFHSSINGLKKQELKLQEAIYEISCGEEDLAEDLQLVQKTYADSLLSLKILTPAEVQLVFGRLKTLLPLHVELYRALRALRSPETGVSRNIGKLVLPWVSKLRAPYIEYCAQLIEVKVFIDAKRDSDKDFCDFLQRCLDSPFSRKLDLWSYLDVPRSRLVKYPLLLKQVAKYSECQADCSMIGAAVRNLEETLSEVDRAMARARCSYTMSRLDWLDESPELKATVSDASEEMLEGTLRNSRGTKLECHLMNTVFIMGRPSTRGMGGSKRLQVYRKPIPIRDMVIEDLDSCSGGGKQGSFKSAFSSSQPVKNGFKIGFKEGQNLLDASDAGDQSVSHNRSQQQSRHQMTHTLIAPDEHSKRQWLTTLQKTIDAYFVASAKKKMAEASLMREISGEEIGDVSQLRGLRQHTPRKFSRSRQALFQKNKRTSPRIKASLSHAALESLKRNGSNPLPVASVRRGLRRRSNNQAVANDENATPCAKPSAGGRAVPKIIVPSSARKSKSAACLRNPKAMALGPAAHARRGGALVTSADDEHHAPSSASRKNRQPLSVTNIPNAAPAVRGRTKSWSQLASVSSAPSASASSTPRYITRSKAKKMSKSMSDLMHL